MSCFDNCTAFGAYFNIKKFLNGILTTLPCAPLISCKKN